MECLQLKIPNKFTTKLSMDVPNLSLYYVKIILELFYYFYTITICRKKDYHFIKHVRTFYSIVQYKNRQETLDVFIT